MTFANQEQLDQISDDVSRIARTRLHHALAARDPSGEACVGDGEPQRTVAGWVLVDRFEENGRSYYVVTEDSDVHSALTPLTRRERQVVSHAALGLSNKEIAHILNIADVTVRVLTARAAAKLGVRTRGELLARLAELSGPNSGV